MKPFIRILLISFFTNLSHLFYFTAILVSSISTGKTITQISPFSKDIGDAALFLNTVSEYLLWLGPASFFGIPIFLIVAFSVRKIFPKDQQVSLPSWIIGWTISQALFWFAFTLPCYQWLHD